MLRLSVAVLLVVCLSVPESEAQAPPEARGVWVHEQHLNDLEQTFQRLSDAGINIAYLRTWYQGRTIYPSDVVEAAGGQRQHGTFAGRDPIQEAIDVAEQYDISVAVWMEYGLVAQTAYASGDVCPAPTGVLAQNPDWSMIDRDGRIATPSSGANTLCFYWMDPAHPEVVGFVADMAAEIAARYPALDIYEADRFRYPSYHWSYSDISVSRYMDETGNVDPRTTSANDPDYIAWRRLQTTNLMGEVYLAVKENNPSMAVSAAVAPPYMIGGSQEKMQYWPAWADSGYVDFLEIMLYLPDSSYPNQLSLARGLVGDFPIYSGIDNANSYDLVGQIEETRRQGVEGVIIWDGRSAIEGSDIELLGLGPFSEKVLPPHDDIRVDDADASVTFDGAWQAIDEGYGGAAHVLPSGASGIAHYELRPVRAGWYAVEGWWPARESNTNEAEIGFGVDEPDWMPQLLSANQREGDRWVRLREIRLAAGQRVTLSPQGAPGGDVVADAFRLARRPGFRIVDALVFASDEIHLRFNRAIDPASLDLAQVGIAGTTVRNVRVREVDPSLLIITTDPLEDGAAYDVTVRHLYDDGGTWTGEQFRSVTADLASVRLLIDDGQSGFNQQGSWTIQEMGGWNGGAFRTAGGGSANRAYWAKAMPEDALFSVAAYIPEGDETRSESAAYLVIHRDGTDTVRVNHRNHPGGWKELGVYRPRNGSQLYVQLMGDISSEGLIVADAVRWQRTLSPVDAPHLPLPEQFEIGAPYPNPTSGRIIFPVSGAPSVLDADISVYDIVGRRIIQMQRLIEPGMRGIDVDLSALAAGAYFVRLSFAAPGVGESRIITRQVAVIR